MPDFLSLEALPARKGDCLILYFGSATTPRVCIVDGGPSQVYGPFLRPRLEDIRQHKALGQTDALIVDLLVVSHLDDDHINGILELVRKEAEIVTGGAEPKYLNIHRMWHNVFDDILGNAADELPVVVNGLAALNSDDAKARLVQILDKEKDESDAVLASIGQGRDLRNAVAPLTAEGLAINAPFRSDDLIQMTETDSDVVTSFGDDLKITIIGPMRAEVDRLQREYDKYLEKKGLNVPAAEAFLASFSKDTSVTNLSSIVMLCEAGGKSILMTGDARGDKVLEGLQKKALLQPGGTFHVDVLKVQHHGSPRSSEAEFFKHVTADHYVFSGNGDHGNPHPVTLEMIRQARNDAPMTFHFTYAIADIDEKSKDYATSRNKPWSPEENGVAHWVATHVVAGGSLAINVPADRRGVRIDLLDSIGF